MQFHNLEQEELLRLSLAAIANGRDAEALELVKALLSRDPDNVHARYLLAAQHAQLGMFDEAEAGLRHVVANPASLPVARLQLAQLLLTQARVEEVPSLLAPVCAQTGALGVFARALVALAQERNAECVELIGEGLGMDQEIPALAADMHRLRDGLRSQVQTPAPPSMLAPARLLAGYSERT